MNLDYTDDTGPIVRGGRWPPVDGVVTVVLIRTENGIALNWPVGSELWQWQMLISRHQYGGPTDLTLTALTVTRAAHIMTLTFWASTAQTSTLPGRDRRRFFVQIKSRNAPLGGIYAYFGAANGRAAVECYVAES